ncbi:SDR family oxidoreductase [Piscinibacter sp. HJYY11]|uniref:SDR family NAD(P)-dependent oxidoreductase n=1 Tax=Piscinibacter sp. HJYY11 TaxID=2801333 RepID=UPI00191E1347|nr:SDR family NAD(P)-dependent oxidoreductase [Piscinibacter sp. HJYY11]MBL0728686.1 SDR family NAD(P)-dependent oxidoreductase [Piscinibacter sp. HJYY11]
MPLNPRLTDWNGRVVWLVGASTGIGRATAAALHARGAQVIVSARNIGALKTFEKSHPGSVGLPLDVTDRDAVSHAAQQLVLHHGRIDLALYCAGYYKALRATQFDLDEAVRHQQVNYIGALHLLDAVLPVLLQQKSGHLSLVSSVAGYRGLPNSLAYGPTKAALINLAETLYLDLQPVGIGASVINPGFVETPLTAQNEFAMPALLTPEQAAEEILKGWAQGRFEIHFPKRFTMCLKALTHVSDALYFRAIRWSTGL